jgi:Tn3 transposase DDE domain
MRGASHVGIRFRIPDRRSCGDLRDHHVTPEDVARLSPLVFEHINLLGRYAFSVPEAVTRGELRPLRNPAEAIEEVA